MYVLSTGACVRWALFVQFILHRVIGPSLLWGAYRDFCEWLASCTSADTLQPACSRLPIGGVTQLLERRSLTGELSLIYVLSIVDMSPICGLGVHYGSTNQANSAFHPFRVGKWVVIHVITWITEVETIKRQTGTVHVVV